MFRDSFSPQVIFSMYDLFQKSTHLKNPTEKRKISTWRSLFPPPVPPPRLFPITVTVFQSSDIFLQDQDSAISLNYQAYKIIKIQEIYAIS